MIDTWNAQTAMVEAAPYLEQHNAQAALAAIPTAREQMRLLPVGDEDRAVINAAIDRFVAAVNAKRGD